MRLKQCIFALVAMLLCAFSANAQVTTEAALKEALTTGGEVTLGADIEVAAQIEIPAGKTVVLDLAGYDIIGGWNGSSTTNHIYALSNSGTLTIKDSGTEGKIVSRGIYNYGKLTLESGTIDACDGNGGYAVNNESGSTFIMNGGVVSASYEDGDAPGDGNYDATALDVPEGCTATLNGGKITSVTNYTYAISLAGELIVPETSTVEVTGAHGAISMSAGSADIDGGTFICSGVQGQTDNVLYVTGGTMDISGGTFEGDSDSASGGCCVSDSAGGATINGGSFSKSSGGDVNGTTGTTINGGTFENLIETQHVAVGATITNAGKTYTKAEDGTMEETTFVAKIGSTTYATFAEALTAASAMSGDVTIEVYDKVTLNTAFSGSYSSINFVGKDTDAEIYLDVQGYITATGKKVSFTDLTLSKSAGGYMTNAGFMNVAFGIYDVVEVAYTNCVFANGAYASSGNVTFNGCTFYRSYDKYGLWAYGDVNATVEDCTFADYRGIKMYAEGAAKTVDLTVKNTDFSAVTDKPAIVLTYGESVVLEGNTYSSTGTFELDLDGAPNGTAVTSDVAPTCKNDNGTCGVLVDGKIYTTVAQAAEVAAEGSNVTLLYSTTDAVEFAEGVNLTLADGVTADNVTVEVSLAGEGTEASPYLISSVADLETLRNKVNAGNSYEGQFVKLAADLTLTEAWTPIGNGTRSSKSYSGNAFKGTFDGDNKSISGLKITSTTGNDAAIGLFGVVDGGTVKNLTLNNVDINVANSDLAGGAIGLMLGGATADNITVNGAIVGNDGVGGIVGRLVISGTIENCTNNASVTSSYGGIGGIVGKAYYEDSANTSIFASIDNCTNNGTVTAPMYVGGIVGLARANVTDCVNNGPVVGGTQTGGIIGQLIAAGTVSGNENKAKITGKNHLGGIIGDYSQSSAYTYNNVAITSNINRGELAATEQCAAIMGCNNIDGFTAMIATGNVSYYYVDGLELFGNPEDMVIDDTNKFISPVAKIGDVEYDTLAEAVAAVEDGGTITMIANETFTENNRYNNGGWWDGLGYSGDKSFTIDLNNFTISQDGALNDYLMWFKNDGAKDNTITLKNGTLDAGTTAYCALATASSNAKKITVNLENISLINNNSNGSTVKVRGGAVLNVKDGTVITGKDSYLGVECSAATVNIYDGAEIYMNGTSSYNGCLAGAGGNGTINVYGGEGLGKSGGFIAMTSGGTINVEGGEWTANTDGAYANDNKSVLVAQSADGAKSIVNVTGGTFKGGYNCYGAAVGDAQINISGGNFNADPATYLAQNYVAVENNGVWNVELAAAKIGETAYATLEEAFAAAAEGETITLLADATPALTSQRAITKAAVIDLGGNTLTLTEDDLYFGTTTFKNGTIVVDPSVYANTAVFWMFANQTLTFDDVDIIATGLTGTYLIGINDGTGSSVNLLNGSSITIDNSEKAELSTVIADNGNGNSVIIKDSKIDVKNVDARLYLGGQNGSVTIENSDIVLNGVKEGFYLRAGQTLAINGTSKVDITLNADTKPRYGINMTDATATYTKAETATVNATVYAPAKGSNSFAYTKEENGYVRVWGEGGGNAKESYELKLYSGETLIATTKLNNVGNILNGDVYVTWNFYYPQSTDEYWTTTWEEGHPNSAAQPTEVELYIDGTLVATTAAKMSGADDVNPVVWRDLGGVAIADLLGEGTETSPYLISNKKELLWFQAKVDEQAADGSTQFAGKYFKLTADIDLAGEDWNPIGSMSGDHGSFKGVFDGGDHTISNLKVEQAGNGIGLFARTAGNAVIKNLKLNNVSVKSTDNSNYAGAVVGNAYASTKIENVHVSGNVLVSGRGYIGGIAGHGYVVMDNVSVVATGDGQGNDKGLITSTFWCAGGILGYAGEGATNIMNANVENVVVTSAAGGLGAIVGMAEDNNGTQPISGSNLSAKDVEIKTYIGDFGDSYANYALGYLYGGNPTSKLTGELSVENVTLTTSNGVAPTAVDAVAKVNDAIYFSLQAALDAAAAGTGNVTVEILADVDLTDVDWNPVTVSAPGYPVVTVEGGNHTITGLSDMLFHSTWAGGSGLIIKDLTIAESAIVNDKDDAAGTVGVGAFIGYPQASAIITLENCHLKNSSVEGGHWTGGLIGMAGGYNGEDGPVFMNLTIKGCSVTGSTITGKGSVGGVIGHGSCAAWTNVVIEETTVSGNTITSTGSSNVKAGAIMGTIGAAGQPTTANGETRTGGASVSATVAGNTVTSNGTEITTIYGRQGTNTGMLYVAGGSYDNYPIEENVTYAAPVEGYEIVENADGTYGIQEAPEASLAGEGTEANPYLISSVDDLVLFRNSVNAGETKYSAPGIYVALGADIDLDGEDWTPIGNINYDSKYMPEDASKVFSGVFNGNGKVISNLKVASTVGDADTQANVGLFGITGEGAVIKDLTLTNVNIETDGRNVGAIAGFAYKTTLKNITVNGNIQIKGGNNVAGIAAMTRHYAMSATDITVSGAAGSAIVGNNIVGGIFAEIAPNGSEQKFDGLNVENVAVTGVGGVGGIVGLLTTGAVENVSVKNVVLTGRTDYQGNAMGRIRLGSVAGLMGGNYATIANETVENVTAKNLDGNAVELPVIGANYDAASNATEAKIGNTYYNTLLTALNAAEAGETVTLLADVETADGIVITDKNLTIDLNGKTYTVTEGASTNNRNFKIEGTSVVTIKNGTMVAAGDYSSGAYGTVRTEGSANVTLEGLKLYNYRGNGLNIKAYTGTTVTVKDTEIYANYGGGIESAGGTIVVDNVTVEQKGMYTAPYNSMAISVNGGGKVTVNSGTFSTECITAEEANNQGTSHGPWVAGVLNSGGTLIINGGTFSNDNFGENSLATYARGAILADTKAKVEINGGTFNVLKNVIDIQNNLGDANNNPSVVLAGGTYNADPRISASYGSNLITLADGCVALPDLNGNYVVGVKPTATVNNLGMTTVEAGDYMVYGSGDNTAEMPLSFVMQFLANQTEADMETSPFADWYGDFVITFTGIEEGSFTADGCYLAGHYGSFGWVKVPVDGMTIENGVRYPVMLGVGMGQKYEYICSSVQDFKCALYLTPEILEANPNIQVKLELGVVDNSKGSDAAASALVNNENVYSVTEYTYDAEDFVVEEPVQTEYEFVDGEFDSYDNAEDVEGATVKYSGRNVSTTWTPLYVPFEIPAEMLLNNGYEVGYITGVREADKDNDGTIDDLAMEIIQIKNTSAILYANHPYFIRSTAGAQELVIELTDVTLYKAEEKVYDSNTIYNKYDVKGNLSLRDGFTDADRGISGGIWEPFVDENETLKPFRFYLTISSRGNSPYYGVDASAVKSMSIVVRGEENEDGTTTIYDVEVDRENDGAIYDLQGRRVLEPEKGGMYIVNGKKVLVK